METFTAEQTLYMELLMRRMARSLWPNYLIYLSERDSKNEDESDDE